MSEREKFSTFLFGRNDIEVLDIKFLRGNSPTLTSEELCLAARNALEDFFSKSHKINTLPAGRRPQRRVAEILSAY